MDDSKVTVAVCGDSFCAASTQDLQVTKTGLRAHFSQILEDHYGYKVLYFAHGGFSNVAIFFQIREALALGAKAVVYNQTWSNRLELYRKDNFDAKAGTQNFCYYDPNYESAGKPYTGSSRSAILSTTHHSIDRSPFFSVSKEQVQAIELWLKYLYNDNVATMVDSWLFDYWHDQVIKANALPIRFNDPNIGKIAYDFSAANPTFDTPFHTDRATQEQIAANVNQVIQQHMANQ